MSEPEPYAAPNAEVVPDIAPGPELQVRLEHLPFESNVRAISVLSTLSIVGYLGASFSNIYLSQLISEVLVPSIRWLSPPSCDGVVAPLLAAVMLGVAAMLLWWLHPWSRAAYTAYFVVALVPTVFGFPSDHSANQPRAFALEVAHLTCRTGALVYLFGSSGKTVFRADYPTEVMPATRQLVARLPIWLWIIIVLVPVISAASR